VYFKQYTLPILFFHSTQIPFQNLFSLLTIQE
jgi:hypothetical protein